MAVSRRHLVIAMASGALASAAGMAVLWRRRQPEDFVVNVLRRHLAGMRVRQEDFAGFAADYVRYRNDYRSRLKVFSVAAMPLRYASRFGLLPAGNGFDRAEDNIVSLFLLSTDFFQNEAAQDRPIGYVGFYDPLSTACRNPLMRFARQTAAL